MRRLWTWMFGRYRGASGAWQALGDVGTTWFAMVIAAAVLAWAFNVPWQLYVIVVGSTGLVTQRLLVRSHRRFQLTLARAAPPRPPEPLRPLVTGPAIPLDPTVKVIPPSGPHSAFPPTGPKRATANDSLRQLLREGLNLWKRLPPAGEPFLAKAEAVAAGRERPTTPDEIGQWTELVRADLTGSELAEFDAPFRGPLNDMLAMASLADERLSVASHYEDPDRSVWMSTTLKYRIERLTRIVEAR